MKTPQAIASNNTYGLDVSYFSKKLKLVLEGLNNYTPEELARELARLAKTSNEIAASCELSHALKAKNESAESRIKELESQLKRKNVLLEATLQILKKLDDASGVESAFYKTAFYDDAECDGMCLAEDIATNLDFYDFDDYKVKERSK